MLSLNKLKTPILALLLAAGSGLAAAPVFILNSAPCPFTVDGLPVDCDLNFKVFPGLTGPPATTRVPRYSACHVTLPARSNTCIFKTDDLVPHSEKLQIKDAHGAVVATLAYKHAVTQVQQYTFRDEPDQFFDRHETSLQLGSACAEGFQILAHGEDTVEIKATGRVEGGGAPGGASFPKETVGAAEVKG